MAILWQSKGPLRGIPEILRGFSWVHAVTRKRHKINCLQDFLLDHLKDVDPDL